MNHSNSTEDDNSKPKRKTMGEWLEEKIMWKIPVYQRHYAWDANVKSGPIHLFWETVEEQTRTRLEGKELPPQHYLGAVLVNEQNKRGIGDKEFHVVDGQQRLTTIQIALLALIKVAEKHDEDIRKELEKYTLSDNNPQAPKSRLFPTNFDAEQFRGILYQSYARLINPSDFSSSKGNASKSKIVDTFDFLQEACNKLVKDNKEHDARSVIDAIKATLINGFDLVLIQLKPKDDPQRIFESLNNYAKPLTTFDLIRNNVFYRAAKYLKDNEDVELFYGTDWKKLEHPYWEKKSNNSKADPRTHIEAYIARMLVTKIKKDFRFNRNEIFRIYKENFSTRHLSIDEEIRDLISYSGIYQCLDWAKDDDEAIDNVTFRGDNFTTADFGVFFYKIWDNRDFYPVIFFILDSDASKKDKCRMLKLLESYVIRRGVCALSAGHYNLQAVSICANMDNKLSYDALSQLLKGSDKETTVFPADDRVIHDCATERFYKSPFQRYVLNQIENSMYMPGDERNSVDETQLTIDHILPKGWEKNAGWKKMVMSNADSSHEALVALYINTIGNLTIMSGKRNTAKSNHSFNEVKELLASSPLRLNSDLAKEDVWNVEQITQRSKKLAEKVCEIWPYDIPG